MTSLAVAANAATLHPAVTELGAGLAAFAVAGAALAIGAFGSRSLRRPRRFAATRSLPRWRRPAPPATAAQWAAFLDAAAAEVRAGSSLTTAWHAAGTRHQPAGHAVHVGRNPADLVGLAATNPDEAVVVQVAGAAVQLGGPVAATLDAGAALLREREAARAEALAHSAQARLSGQVLTAVPLLFCAWSMATSASVRAAIASPAGLVSCALGAALNLIGWWWMRTVVARAGRA